MKRTMALLFALLMLAGLAGCGSPAAGESDAAGSGNVVDYKIDVPEGFEARDIEGFVRYYMTADGSNVNLNAQEKSSMDDAAFKLVTAEMLRSTLVSGFESAYDITVEITDRYFTQEPVSGFPAYQYAFSYELEGVQLSQLIVSINADRIYTVTYTDASGDWMKAFEESAKNIELITG